ncbi:hypothetical protein [Mycolicibacterium agri]|uniref:Uncharacterized protein n=1 Tax=Mycolicibacterium agri TaxID=36811 RepID=A0A7I9VTR3_MYCAG|nr:hypothetical protein [Mycolicibacterium agri]GFG48700.1 hypothetical protein MAGR_01410 [Mycolicibacterium agri]
MASEPQQDQQDQQQDEQKIIPKPEVTDEHRQKAKEMAKEYHEERPTVTMPGSDGTVSGTAVNEWLDDDGNPKFSDESKGGADQS